MMTLYDLLCRKPVPETRDEGDNPRAQRAILPKNAARSSFSGV